MNVICDLCVIPIGVGVSLSTYIAAAIDEIESAGLDYTVHAYGTNVEGDYDLVFDTLKRALTRIHEMGAPRISCTIKLGTRTDRPQSMRDKLTSIEEKRGT